MVPVRVIWAFATIAPGDEGVRFIRYPDLQNRRRISAANLYFSKPAKVAGDLIQTGF
jgi:hypothetical protein